VGFSVIRIFSGCGSHLKATFTKPRRKIRMSICAVVGLGYVGLPLAVHMCEAGHQVFGFDVSRAKVTDVVNGAVDIGGDYSSRVQAAIRSGSLVVTWDPEVLQRADFISLCVPTPLDHMKTPDLTFIQSAAEQMSRWLRTGQTIILESTTYPGTTEDLVRPILEQGGLRAGADFYLAYSPERVDPGNKRFDTSTTPKVVGADDLVSLGKAVTHYETFVHEVVPVRSTRAAEMTKLLENTFRAVNIAFVNEMAIMCERLGIDVWEVVEAASTKPFGFMPFFPGPGIGGHCIPLDPLYLSWKAKSVNFFSRFIETAADVNNNMPRYVVDKVLRLLGTSGVPLRLAHVLVLGVSYKPDVSDYRESPGHEILELLLAEGLDVDYHDPHIPDIRLGSGREVKGVGLSELSSYDCVVATVGHSVLDLSDIAARARLIFDARNMFSGHSGNIVRLGDGTMGH